MTHQPQINSHRTAILGSLKRAAKALRHDHNALTQAKALDSVASQLGYKNWALLSKDVGSSTPAKLEGIYRRILDHALLGDYATLLFSEAEARNEMEEWVRSKFTPLVHFAYYDRESENGFAWDDEDLAAVLEAEFGDRFPLKLILDVAASLEANEGPWGIEYYGEDNE